MCTISMFAVWGHILVGFYFAFFGLWNIYHWTPYLATMARKRIPHAYLFLALGIAWQFTAGTFIIFGVFVKLAAILLIPFTIAMVCIFYDFWNQDGALRRLNFNLFISNLTVSLGALLLML